jgi:DnaJ-domain-containing protein 1
MTLVCIFPVASMAASVVAHSLVFALATPPQLNAGDGDAPTPKEQALIEHACGTPRTPAAYAASERCAGARLVSLRADFGRDLSRLSPVARKKLDATCSPLQASRGREAYIDCLSVQLASLSPARVRATPPAAEKTLSPPIATPSSAASSTETVRQGSSLLSAQSAAIFFAAFAGITALVILGVKGRRAKLVCRVCGVSVPGAGDLCTPCRRDAADAVRQAAGERVERQRANEAQQRRQREQADEQRHEKQRQEQEDGRLEEGRHVQEESRRREEDAQFQAKADHLPPAQTAAECDAVASVFDPYRALGLMSNASGDEVRAAYEEARVKYDPDQVAHLGSEVLEHYSAKFHASERAYQMLAGPTAQ